MYVCKMHVKCNKKMNVCKIYFLGKDTNVPVLAQAKLTVRHSSRPNGS